MWVPLVSNRSNSTLGRRKGGGGGGHGGGGHSGGGRGGGGGRSSGSSKSSSSSSSGKSTTVPSRTSTPISIGGKSTRNATPYAFGGGAVSTLPYGSFFSGRSVGGGNRTAVYGSRTYGSGYPGSTGRGVSGRGFPFYFWPVAWGGAAAALGAAAYLHIDDFGAPDNSSRPGGGLVVAEFRSSDAAQNTSTQAYFRLVADNATVTALVPDIIDACVSLNLGNANGVHIVNFTGSNSDMASPRPEQTVQYYRASSVALTYDGYNNTAVFMPEGTVDVPLPGEVDLTLLNCLNSTIGQAVPLVAGSVSRNAPPAMGFVGLVYLVYIVFSSV